MPDASWRARAAIIVPLVVVSAAGLLRFVDLGQVDRIHFDEIYYANEARQMLADGVPAERPAHPPVGRWVIAGGIAVLGFDPVGWRFGAALTGTLTVLVTYALGVALLGRRGLAAAAAVLVAVDGLAITTSRVAMLDAIGAFFVALTALLVVRHHQRHRDRTSVGWLPPGYELWGAGVAAGLAIGTKWSAGPFLLAAIGAATWTEARRRIRATPVRVAASRSVVGVALPLLVVPFLVYLASYSGFFLNYRESAVYRQRCPSGDCAAPLHERAEALAWHHGDLARMHRELEHDHPYRSAPATWPLMQRPVLSYLERCPTDGPCAVPEGTSARIVMVGNPALWWLACASVPFLGWRAFVRRERGPAIVLAFALALYLPWLLVGSGFVYYLTPVVPFAALGVVLALSGAPWSPLRRVGPWIAVAAGVAFLALLHPIWYGIPLDPAGTDARLLLESWR